MQGNSPDRTFNPRRELERFQGHPLPEADLEGVLAALPGEELQHLALENRRLAILKRIRGASCVEGVTLVRSPL